MFEFRENRDDCSLNEHGQEMDTRSLAGMELRVRRLRAEEALDELDQHMPEWYAKSIAVMDLRLRYRNVEQALEQLEAGEGEGDDDASLDDHGQMVDTEELASMELRWRYLRAKRALEQLEAWEGDEVRVEATFELVICLEHSASYREIDPDPSEDGDPSQPQQLHIPTALAARLGSGEPQQQVTVTLTPTK